MDLTPFLLKPGDVCTAWGVVVAADEQVTFRPASAMAAIAPTPRPRHGEGAIPIAGIDLADLMFTYEVADAISGQATVTVIWREGLLEVVDQRAERPAFTRRKIPSPPDPAPPGGWEAVSALYPPTPLMEDLNAAELLVAMTMARLSDSAKIPVITATNREEVLRRLGPALSAAVCVVQSRYTAAQITEMSQHALQHWDAWGCYRTGQRTDSDFQVRVDIRVGRVRPELVEWMADVPDDLVKITTWLDPTRSGPPILEL